MVEERTTYLSLNFKTGIILSEKYHSIFLDHCRALEEPQSGLKAKLFFRCTSFVSRSGLFDQNSTEIDRI